MSYPRSITESLQKSRTFNSTKVSHYKKLHQIDISAIIVGVMGEFADMTLDECDWDWEDAGLPKRKIVIACRGCKKSGLKWRRVDDIWVLMESTGGVHSCATYTPPINALKKISKEVVANVKLEELWRLKEQSKEGRDNLIKMLPVLTNAQLIDLYSCFVRDDQMEYDEPDIGMPISYKHEISLLKKEILARLDMTWTNY
jgi:hypothetical protein